MKQYISVLRGINVGGHRKILMPDLKNLFVGLGFLNIETYIQSGNIIFSSKDTNTCAKIACLIQRKIKDIYDFDIPVMVITAESLCSIVKNNPFVHDKDTENLFLSFLSKKPDRAKLSEINKSTFLPDSFEIIGAFVFIYCEGKFSQTKLNNQFFEKKLKVSSTTRNWKTILKLSEMILPSSHKKS